MSCAYTCYRTDPTKTVVSRPAMVRCYHCNTVERKEMEFLGILCKSVEREWMEYKPLPGTTVCPNSRDKGLSFFESHFREIREITGTLNTDTPCDHRCQEAVGPVCVCSCGGLNHARARAILAEKGGKT